MNIFKSPRRLRVEKKRRTQEREKQKSELEKLNLMYKDRASKMKLMKRVEHTPTFMKDFEKMKELLKKPEPLISDDFKKPKQKKNYNNLGDFL